MPARSRSATPKKGVYALLAVVLAVQADKQAEEASETNCDPTPIQTAEPETVLPPAPPVPDPAATQVDTGGSSLDDGEERDSRDGSDRRNDRQRTIAATTIALSAWGQWKHGS